MLLIGIIASLGFIFGILAYRKSSQNITNISGPDFPSGTILMWNNPNNIPAGWIICDGSQGSPNLSGKVPVGVGNNETTNYTMGMVGGAETVTLSAANLAPHYHSLYASNDPSGQMNNTAPYLSVSQITGYTPKGDDGTFYTYPNSKYSKADPDQLTSKPFSIMMPYSTVVFIYKI